MSITKERLLNLIGNMTDVIRFANKEHDVVFDMVNRAYRLGYYAGKNNAHDETTLLPRGTSNKPKAVK